MAVPTETGAAFRVRLPAQLVRGKDSKVRLYAYLGTSSVAASATVVLQSPSGEVLVEDIEATITAGAIVATVPADDLPTTLSYGPSYRLIWTVTLTDDTEHEVPQSAMLVKYPLHCPVAVPDLTAQYPDIDKTLRTSMGSSADLQGFIDAAWEDTLHRLARDGRWVGAIVNADALTVVVRELALAKLWRFKSATKTPDGMDDRTAQQHQAAADREWTQLTFQVDRDQDGVADSDDRVGVQRVFRRGAPSDRFSWGNRGLRTRSDGRVL